MQRAPALDLGRESATIEQQATYRTHRSIAGAALAFLVASSLVAAACREGPLPDAPAEPSTSPAAPADGPRIIRDRRAGVQVSCPATWSCSEGEHSGDSYLVTPDGRADGMLQVVAGATTLDEAIAKVKLIGEAIESRTFEAPSDHPLGKVVLSTGSGDPEGGPAKKRYWSLFHDLGGGRIVVCQGSAALAVFDSVAAEIRAICESMKPL